MKLFVKISLLSLVFFCFWGDYATKAMGHSISSHSVVAPVKNKVVKPAEDLASHGLPAQKVLQRLFHHGIDENFFTLPVKSNMVVYSFIDVSAVDLNLFQNKHRYYYIACQAFPGYQVHLLSLPLRSPPFSC